MEPQETQVSVRLPYAIVFVLILIISSSLVSYRIGKGQAYREIIDQCISHRVSAALCFLASEQAMRELEMLSNEQR